MEENKLTEKKSVSIAQFKEEPIWTNWTYYTTKNGNITKQPLSKVNDSTTWVTYREANNRAKWSKETMGVGIIFAPHSSGLAICGIALMLITLTLTHFLQKSLLCSATPT